MKKLIIAAGAAGALLLALLCALSSVTAQFAPAPFDAVQYARDQQTIAQIATVAPYQTFTAIVLALLPAALAIVGLSLLAAFGGAAAWRFFRERRPDRDGLLPVNAYTLDDVAPQALGAYHGARQLAAGQQPVPYTLTYSPSYAPHSAPQYAPQYSPRLDYRRESSGLALPTPDEPAAATQLPGLTDLADIVFHPSKERILLGLAEGGELITVPAPALCHVALVGATGGGKSNLMRLLLPQLQAVGARVLLADPHFAPVDPESGEDWRAIAARLYTGPAVKPGEIGELLAFLTEELDRRIEMRRKGEKWGAPYFLAMDELPVIAETVPDAIEDLGRLLREGRKVGIYSVGASQSMLVKVIGGDSSAREAYRTAYYVGGDLRSASILLDIPQRDIDDGPLGAGVALLRSKATTPATLVRVPYASNAGVARILGAAPEAAPSAPPERRPLGFRPRAQGGAEGGAEGAPHLPHQNAPEWTPEELRILAAFRAGKSASELAAELNGGKRSGNGYNEAARRIAEVLRKALA